MTANPALLDYLLTRRSTGIAFLRDPGPTPEELQTLLTIATRVPDHGKIAPWRLVLIEGDNRMLAGKLLAEIAHRNNPQLDEASLEAERQRFLPAPLTIGVISAPQLHPKVPEFEQLISAGNVAFNLLHGAAALGYGASWVTRWYAFDEEAGAMLGAKPGERFVGFVHVGTATAKMDDRSRPDLDSVVTRWSEVSQLQQS